MKRAKNIIKPNFWSLLYITLLLTYFNVILTLLFSSLIKSAIKRDLVSINTINNYASQSQTSKNISSESVGSYSVSYITGTQIQETINSKNAELTDIVLTYLTGVIVNGEHLVYLGVN